MVSMRTLAEKQVEEILAGFGQLIETASLYELLNNRAMLLPKKKKRDIATFK